MSESDERSLQEEDGNGGWESSWQSQARFALKKFRFPRRHCGREKQTFQAKGVAWAEPRFPNRVYQIEGTLVIRTFYCVNKELEAQKARGRIGTSTFSFFISFPAHSSVQVGWAVSWVGLTSPELPPYCVSQRSLPRRGFLLFFSTRSFFARLPEP